jgi:hypothetical protein
MDRMHSAMAAVGRVQVIQSAWQNFKNPAVF